MVRKFFPRPCQIRRSLENVSISRGYLLQSWVLVSPRELINVPIVHHLRDCRGVSLIHVSIVIPLAIRCLDSPELSADRVFGWDGRAGILFAISAGYFLWDAIDTIVHFEALGFVAHGLCHPLDPRPVRTLMRDKQPQVQHVSLCTFCVS